MTGPWTRAFLAAVAGGAEPSELPVEDLRVEPSLVTARVGDETVTLAAPPIPAGVWAAVEPVPTTQSESFAHTLEHTWEEPLVPDEVVTVGSPSAVAAVAAAVAAAIDRDPSTLVRFRGHGAAAAGDDPWRGRELPELPPPARRPPDSVPNRLGTSGIPVAGGDLVEAAVRMYRSFAA